LQQKTITKMKKILWKATNKDGMVARDKMNDEEFSNFLRHNEWTSYTYDSYTKSSMKDKIKNILQHIVIVLTFLGIGVLILEALVRI